ncbi:MAG: hypothetical protein LUD18_00980 [Lachnospiraceae bacterium]|nr:hypothetical protein [Lachnospiraceae bacterium]
MAELHNHTENAEKFKSALGDDAYIYQHHEQKTGREQMAGLHGKDKWEFFKEYYARTILAVAVIAAVCIYFVYNYVTTNEYALNILAVNAYNDGNEEFEEEYLNDFLERNGIDTSEYEASVNRSITVDANSSDSLSTTSVETIYTLFAAGEVDLFFADNDYFLSMATMDYVNNLEDYLTEEEIAALDEDSLVYVTVNEDEDDEPMEGSNAGKTILAGIRLSQDEGWLGEMDWYPQGIDVIVGISGSVKHEELAVSLLREILAYGE